MNDLMLNLSQMESISSLPRNYGAYLRRAETTHLPVIFLKRNRPAAALIDWHLLVDLWQFKAQIDEEKALAKIAQSEEEFKNGKAKVLKSLAILE